MSGPLSSLKKPHKTPLFAGSGENRRAEDIRPRPSVPFRKPAYSDDESKLLDEIAGGMASSRIKTRDPFSGGLPKINESSPRHSQGFNMTPRTGELERSPSDLGSPAPNDHEIMSTMITRITQLEAKVAFQAKELGEKEKTIKVLQEKVKLLQKAQDSTSSSHMVELENKCYLLQNQVHDMEDFLQDYGMVWVGPAENSDDEDNDMWRPGSSVSQQSSMKVDYNLIIENIKELNILAGEGVASVKHTTGGARLKMPDPVQLTLYANGILMFSGPFRPFTDALTQACVRDLQDGYFPGELQDRYPDGVPFNVTDKREVYYEEKKTSVFMGAGQALGGETKPSKLVPTTVTDQTIQQTTDKTTDTTTDTGEPDTVQRETTSELPGPQLTVSQFLERLPKSVVKAGKVIDIRSSIGTTLQGGERSNSDVTLIETDAVIEMKKRLEANSGERPFTPRDITTLRVKSEDGNHTYILKMKFGDTIGTLRQCLQNHRGSANVDFDIVSAYPNRTHRDDNVTLQDAGLTPNAVAHLKVRKS